MIICVVKPTKFTSDCWNVYDKQLVERNKINKEKCRSVVVSSFPLKDHNLGPTETLKSKTLLLANFVKHIKKQNKTKELSEPSLKRSKKKETTLLPNWEFTIRYRVVYTKWRTVSISAQTPCLGGGLVQVVSIDTERGRPNWSWLWPTLWPSC